MKKGEFNIRYSGFTADQFIKGLKDINKKWRLLVSYISPVRLIPTLLSPLSFYRERKFTFIDQVLD